MTRHSWITTQTYENPLRSPYGLNYGAVKGCVRRAHGIQQLITGSCLWQNVRLMGHMNGFQQKINADSLLYSVHVGCRRFASGPLPSRVVYCEIYQKNKNKFTTERFVGCGGGFAHLRTRNSRMDWWRLNFVSLYGKSDRIQGADWIQGAATHYPRG